MILPNKDGLVSFEVFGRSTAHESNLFESVVKSNFGYSGWSFNLLRKTLYEISLSSKSPHRETHAAPHLAIQFFFISVTDFTRWQREVLAKLSSNISDCMLRNMNPLSCAFSLIRQFANFCSLMKSVPIPLYVRKKSSSRKVE